MRLVAVSNSQRLRNRCLRVEKLEDRLLLHGSAHNGDWVGVTATGGTLSFHAEGQIVSSSTRRFTINTPGDGGAARLSNATFPGLVTAGNNDAFDFSQGAQGGNPSYSVQGTLHGGEWAEGTIRIIISGQVRHTEQWTARRPLSAPASITISRSSGSMAEAGGQTNVIATPNFPWALSRTIDLSYAGTATKGTAYSFTPTEDVVIAPFALTGSTRINAIDDSVDEPNETVSITVGGVSNGEITTPSTLSAITIVDDDPPPNMRPMFTSPTTANVPENTTAVMTMTATDSDLPPQTITFSIIGGADQAQFHLISSSILAFKMAPNFEVPSDANSDNIYLVSVKASDANGGTATQTINVTVRDVPERLSGDYNDDGAVDAGDYVVWRKALNSMVPHSTGADGNGDGKIDQADYDVWRANFGKSASVIGTGSFSSFDDSSDKAGTKIRTNAASLVNADAAPSVTAAAVVQANRAGTHTNRPLPRAAFAEDRSREDALIAWLMSPATQSRRESRAGAFSDLLTENGSDNDAHQLDNALDIAFATL
jgi:hypothetical protein